MPPNTSSRSSSALAHYNSKNVDVLFCFVKHQILSDLLKILTLYLKMFSDFLLMDFQSHVPVVSCLPQYVTPRHGTLIAEPFCPSRRRSA